MRGLLYHELCNRTKGCKRSRQWASGAATTEKDWNAQSPPSVDISGSLFVSIPDFALMNGNVTSARVLLRKCPD